MKYKFAANATIGEVYGPGMEITDPEEASEYFEAVVKHTMEVKPCFRSEAEEIVKSNLGYYAGYYSNETRKRVEKLFNCAHPIFGSISSHGTPTPEEAFQMGLDS